jgi:hypothetical protein
MSRSGNCYENEVSAKAKLRSGLGVADEPTPHGELLGEFEERTSPPSALPKARSAQGRYLRLHRGLTQHDSTTKRAWLTELAGFHCIIRFQLKNNADQICCLSRNFHSVRFFERVQFDLMPNFFKTVNRLELCYPSPCIGHTKCANPMSNTIIGSISAALNAMRSFALNVGCSVCANTATGFALTVKV